MACNQPGPAKNYQSSETWSDHAPLVFGAGARGYRARWAPRPLRWRLRAPRGGVAVAAGRWWVEGAVMETLVAAAAVSFTLTNGIVST